LRDVGALGLKLLGLNEFFSIVQRKIRGLSVKLSRLDPIAGISCLKPLFLVRRHLKLILLRYIIAGRVGLLEQVLQLVTYFVVIEF
jgi:hypothetical protein